MDKEAIVKGGFHFTTRIKLLGAPTGIVPATVFDGPDVALPIVAVT